MTVVKATFSRDKLLAAPQQERALFLALGHLADEINALNKLLLWANEYPANSQAESDGRLTLILLFIRLLAGKLYEAWELLRKAFYGTAISRSYEPGLPEEGRVILGNLKKYFGSENLLSRLRNSFSFHYSPSDIDASFPHISESLHLYMQKGGTFNNLYYFAELSAAHAMLEHAKTPEDPIGYLRLSDEVTRVAGWVAQAADHLMTHFLKLHGIGIWEGTVEYISFEGLPKLLDIALPWFTDPDEEQHGSA